MINGDWRKQLHACEGMGITLTIC